MSLYRMTEEEDEACENVAAVTIGNMVEKKTPIIVCKKSKYDDIRGIHNPNN